MASALIVIIQGHNPRVHARLTACAVSLLLATMSTMSWSSARADTPTAAETPNWPHASGLGTADAGATRIQLAELTFDARIRDTAGTGFVHEATGVDERARAHPRARLKLWPWLEAAVAAVAAVSGGSLALEVQRGRELAALERGLQLNRARVLPATRLRAPRLASAALTSGMVGMAGFVSAAVKRLTIRTSDTDNAWALRIGGTHLTLTTHF